MVCPLVGPFGTLVAVCPFVVVASLARDTGDTAGGAARVAHATAGKSHIERHASRSRSLRSMRDFRAAMLEKRE